MISFMHAAVPLTLQTKVECSVCASLQHAEKAAHNNRDFLKYS